MYSIELLVSEHKNIIRLNNVMRSACLHILENGIVDTGDFHKYLSFIREYADKNHHGKEELFLFKEMQDRLGSAAQTLVQNGMLVEHDLARLYVHQLDCAITAFEENGTAENKLDIIANTMSYSDLLHRHIERENGAVYPFAERGLPLEVLEELDSQTHAFEAANSKEREYQLSILMELEQKYIR